LLLVSSSEEGLQSIRMTSQGYNESKLVHVLICHPKGMSENTLEIHTVGMHTFVVFRSLRTGNWGFEVVTDLKRKEGRRGGLGEVLVAMVQCPQSQEGALLLDRSSSQKSSDSFE
jgi:hypothetical protein